ncbi:LOW QUALITY PROTEIN: core histone macro-H2A.1-like [Paramacrobiotus metropolitanus]|uniref:LOW QUALITY PROTEIN: core histone macro-H2A.1-like n=1 Tax=Paramacrobiotus metropolitanus TaxID=2943436 RepID=UPI002445F6C4|nr:LOW QUALITY PROTEIN: core histone macro-H2A.1-like [Paramacrobiotus metropolitanus]
MGRGTGAKVSRSRRGFYEKTGVTFPVRRIQRYLKGHHLVNRKARVSTTGALYLSAVLEYIVAEVLELAGMAAKQNKKAKAKTTRINPRWIWLAIKSDDEFRKLMRGSIMPECGNLWGGTATTGTGNATTTAQTNTSLTTPKIPVKTVRTVKSTTRKTTAKGRKPAPWQSVPQPLQETMRNWAETSTLGRTLISGVQLSILKADIASVEADCYVNPTSSSVGFGGQVGSRLSSVGGAALMTATQPFMSVNIPNNGAVRTPAAGLKAQHIIHCNSPSWNTTNAIQSLEETVKNCLDVVCDNHIRTVAIPSIGSGGNQFPKQTAARTILAAISQYFKNKPRADIETEKIIFVLFDKQSVNIYRTELARLVE